jgi:class 3 adenylate cyclase
MEKIKTIGDAYMCACGLPQSDNENALKAVMAGLDMQNFIKGFGQANKIQDLPVYEIRIGIHTGPLVAGVVGLKKFAYDIWGDAVNIAAQMEQNSVAGKVNISAETHALIKDHFQFTYRGKIETKSKGVVDMYFVETVNQ